jgi:pimeloyl-ACP methyl ester carboxylesterase
MTTQSVTYPGAGEPTEGPALFDSQFSHGFVTVDDHRLHYVRGGTGRTLVLLHGFPATWYDWHSIMPRLAATGHDVIAFDLPGLGDSEPLTDPFTHRDIARLLHKACLSLGLTGPDLIAHDMGAWLAYPLLREDPAYFRRAVILDVSIPGLGLEPQIREIFLWHFNFHQGARNLAAQLVEGREELYLTYFFNLAARPDAITPGERAEFLRAYAKPGALRTAFGYYEGIEAAGQDNQAHIGPKLTLPVLALGGEFGGGAPIASWQHVAETVIGETAAHTGHYLTQEQPDWLLERVIPFLAEAVFTL